MSIENQFGIRKVSKEEIAKKTGVSVEELERRAAEDKKIAAAAKEADVDVPTYKKMLEKGEVKLEGKAETAKNELEQELKKIDKENKKMVEKYGETKPGVVNLNNLG